MMEFIGARAIQGIGAGAVATLPFVLLGVVYPPNKRGRALGAAASAWAVASVAGPLLGTLIVTHVSWRWAFLINVPIAIVASPESFCLPPLSEHGEGRKLTAE